MLSYNGGLHINSHADLGQITQSSGAYIWNIFFISIQRHIALHVHKCPIMGTRSKIIVTV